MNDKQSIGDKIKTLRQRKRWSQERLVEVAREYTPPGRVLNRESISFYENGKTRPDLWVITALAKAFGVSVEYIVGDAKPDMLTPQPELWDVVADINKQPVLLRELAARLISAALDYARMYANLSQSDAKERGVTRGQELGAWAEQSAENLMLESLLQSGLHRDETVNDIPLNGGAESPQEDDAAQSETDLRSGQ